MDLQLAKKNAVVTGAASGVGRSIALCLSGEGANVVISDIAMEKAENAAGECVQLIDRAEELLGPLDILVNSAGIWPANLVVDIPVEEWRKTFDVNLRRLLHRRHLRCHRWNDHAITDEG
jgi:3-oxoacyl-[acyl-carrier protein] reductase